jgi:hypothetical protein
MSEGGFFVKLETTPPNSENSRMKRQQNKGNQ